MNFLEVMQKRHSSRDFKKDEVPEETLKEIVKIASSLLPGKTASLGTFT